MLSLSAWSYVVVYAVIGDETQTHVHTQMHTETPSILRSVLLGDPGAHSRSALAVAHIGRIG